MAILLDEATRLAVGGHLTRYELELEQRRGREDNSVQLLHQMVTGLVNGREDPTEITLYDQVLIVEVLEKTGAPEDLLAQVRMPSL